MITYYGYDNQLIYTNPVEFDPYGPIPPNTTEVEPPKVRLPKVAQWQGLSGWVVLDARPEIPVPEPTVEIPAPELIVPPVPYQKIDFLRLFTQAERIAIREAAKVNLVVEDYQYMLDNSTVILLTDSDIQTGVPLLEAAGLIGVGRAEQILAGVKPS